MKKERHDFDLINELPHIYELEDMISFCKKYQKIYIYGRAPQQEYLAKYLHMCDIEIAGYVVTKLKAGDNENYIYKRLTVEEITTVLKEQNVGIIIGLPDKHYHEIIPMLRKQGFEDYFIMTEYNKRAIASQMHVRNRRTLGFEISLADHCNLSCQMCDHFSQLSEESFADVAIFERDIKRMGELFGHQCGPITLLGGEPTLHKDLIKCIKIVRKEFPDAVLGILTNGVLLLEWENSPNGNLWEACKEYDVRIEVTVYPIKLDFEAIEAKAKEYDVDLIMSSNIHAEELSMIKKISDKHTMDLKGEVPKLYFINCLYFNKFNVLKDGRLYMCPIAAHIDILNNRFNTDFELREEDSLDIFAINSWEDIANWTTNYIPFCRYCDLKNWNPHSEWKASSKTLDEYV